MSLSEKFGVKLADVSAEIATADAAHREKCIGLRRKVKAATTLCDGPLTTKFEHDMEEEKAHHSYQMRHLRALEAVLKDEAPDAELTA